MLTTLQTSSLRLNRLATAMAVVLGGVALAPSVWAAAPAAGTQISNQASASYNDSTGAPQNVLSNSVVTTVAKVASLTLTADQTKLATANGIVTLPHTLTNTGNGTDSFTLTAANLTGTDDFDVTNIKIFRDANGDGVADDNVNLAGQTVTLAAGASTGLILQVQAPATATDTNSDNVINALATITATSVFATSQTATNTDTIVFSTGGVINITKGASVTTTTAGSTYNYTFNVQNSGNAQATAVTITDMLPAGVTAVTPLPAGVTTSVDVGTGRQIVTIAVGTVNANVTQTVTLPVNVASTVGGGDLDNQASYTYDPDGAGGQPATSPVNTNTNTVTVPFTYSGTINDDPAIQTALGVDDISTTTMAQGVPHTFSVYVHNTSNTTETFNLTAGAATTAGFTNLPAGSVVEFFKADGVTPLTNTNAGDSTVDTGPMAAGTNLEIKVKITLPPSYSGTTDLESVITSDPVSNASAAANDTTKLQITDVTPAGLDITDGNGNDATLEGVGTANNIASGTVADTYLAAPGGTVLVPFTINNSSTIANSIALSSTPPAGMTVVFYQNTGTAAAPVKGIQVTNVTVAGSGSGNYVAEVTVPASQLAGTVNLGITGTSSTSGASDSILNAIQVSEVRQVSLVASQTNSVNPGGTVNYTHTLTNTGNTTEGNAAGELVLSFAQTNTTFPVTIFVDVNNDGVYSASEQLPAGGDLNSLIPGGLAPGASVNILVKEQAPANAAAGTQDVLTLTADVQGTGATAASDAAVTDTTTVVLGTLRLYKYQALDANCDGAEVPTVVLPPPSTTISAKPGECIVYRIVASNEGNAAVSSVAISDSAPAYTTLQALPRSNNGTTGTVSTSGTTVTNTVGTLAAQASAELLFSVKVDQ